MKITSVEQEIRRREQWMLRGKHPVCKALYLAALAALILLGGIIRIACLGSSIQLELHRCLAPVAVGAVTFFLLRRYPILRLLRDHPGIGAMLLCYLLGLLCVLFYRSDYRKSISTWPTFMFISVLIVAAVAFAMQGYRRCTPFFVVGAAAIVALLSLGMGNSFSAMLALLLALVLGCIAAYSGATVQKRLWCLCVIGVWLLTVLGFAVVSNDFCLGVFGGFTDFSVSPLDPQGIGKYYGILRACRFFGTSETGALSESAQCGVMLTAAVKLGWGLFALLVGLMVMVLVTGMILTVQWKGMTRLLGAGAMLSLLYVFLGEPMRAFGIESPFLYAIPFLSGDAYASTMTLLTVLLVFPFERLTIKSQARNAEERQKFRRFKRGIAKLTSFWTPT